MIPLRITIHLVKSMYLPLGKRPVYMHFDSLLSGLIAKKKGFKKETLSPASVREIEKELDNYLRKSVFNGNDFYYHASAIYTRPSKTLISKTYWVKRMDWSEKAAAYIKDIGIVRKDQAMDKDALEGSPTIITPAAFFWCVGDPGKIENILEILYYTGLGTRNAIGGGDILGYHVEPVEDIHNYSVLDWNNNPARMIPVDAEYKGNICSIGKAAYRPPYWVSSPALCYLPENRFGENGPNTDQLKEIKEGLRL